MLRQVVAIWILGMLAIALSAVAAPSPHFPNPFPPGDTVAIQTLPNGLRLVVHEDHSLPVVAAVAVVRGGSAAEANTRGMAHYLEHLTLQGSVHYPEPLAPQYALESVGGVSNALTARDMTAFQATVSSSQAELLLRVLADVTLQPLLTDEAFAGERPVILAEIQQEADDPVASIIHKAYTSSYGTHPYREDPKGAIEDILSLTSADVRAFHRRWYVPNNMSIVLVGDITASRAFELAQQYFGAAKAAVLPKRPPVEAATRGPVRRDATGDFADSYQALVFAAPGVESFAAVVATDVALSVLIEGEDALFPARWARDGVAVKRFGGEYVTMRDPGRFVVWAQTAPEMTERLRASTLALLRELAAGNIPEAALTQAKQRLAAQFLLDNETYGQQAATLAFYEGVGGAKQASYYLPTMEGITVQQVRRAIPTQQLEWLVINPSAGGGR